MGAAYFTPKVFAIFGLLIFATTVHAQQYSAGINTENPNANAVLHLVAPNGDQGLLIPTLTTGQRTTMGLTATDNGMLVFDTDDGLFYYWLNPSWIPLTTTDSDNQTLSIAGTNLTISNGNTVDIGVAESDPTVPAAIKDGIDWTEISGIPAGFSDDTDDGIASVLTDATINGDGIGTPLSVNVGTGANQIVQLNGTGQLPAFDASNLTNLNAGVLFGVLPAIDGSNLTGVTSAVITDGTTITGDGSATQLAVGTVPAAQVSGLATIATTGSFGDLTLVPVGLADGDDVGLTTVTSADIVDNEIANIDINAAANIAATKLESTVMVEGENVGLLNNDVGYMTAGTYDPNTIAGDVFDFGTHPTATAPGVGDVLTWDGTTWDALPSTGLTLPYTQSVANAADLFYLTNTGLGGAGAFEINNITNATNALNATTNGIGAAIQATQAGTAGPGMDVSISGATNTSPGILVSHGGAGAGLNISLSNATNPDAGLSVNHAGLGAGIEITTSTGPPMFITGGNAGEVLTSDALGNITLQPGGIAFPFAHTEDTDPTDLFYLDQQGTLASAARFTNSTGAFTGSVVSIEGNGLSGSQGLAVTQIGAGDAGTFLVSGAGAGTAVYGSTTGTGVAGLFEISNAGNTSPVIEVINGGAGADIRLPTGATAGYVLTSDATGNASWQVNGLTLPYADSGTDVGSLFSISNAGTGPAAFFENTGSGTAVRLGGNILFNEGAGRIIGVQQNTVGNGDNLAIAAADGEAAGPADGGILSLRSGAGTGTGGNGGNIEIIPGAGSGGGFAGGVFVNGITRFGNQGAGFGGMIELEDDAGTNSIGIEADPTTASYIITLPPAQAAGALTNDGTGTLSWVNGANAFTLDGNNNLTAITGATPPGTENFLVGVNTGNSLVAGGNQNTLIGNGAGQSITTGSTNIVIGVNAGGAGLTTGNNNVVLGTSASVSENTTSHVVIGDGATSNGFSTVSLGPGASIGAAVTGSIALGAGSSATGDNSVAIGFNANAPQDNSAIIGDATVPGFFVGVGTQTPTAKLSVENGNATGQGMAINMVAASANPDQALLIAQNADGMGADIRITNSASASAALSASTQGTGNVGVFDQQNVTSGANAMFVQTLGLGGAGVFQISNTASTVPALSVNTDGNNSNGIAVSKTGTSGNGIIIDMNGAGGQGIFVGGTNPASSSIETDGDVLFRANFITPTISHDAVAQPVIPSDVRIVKIVNGGPDINEITAGVEGQEILIISDFPGGFNVNSMTSVNLRLDNDNAFTMNQGSSLHLVYIETLNRWVEIGRSQ
tara:strand:- start:114815 stop:118708 length:3894 start_codon:yes stop_codon:yes gene_type:complete